MFNLDKGPAAIKIEILGNLRKKHIFAKISHKTYFALFAPLSDFLAHFDQFQKFQFFSKKCQKWPKWPFLAIFWPQKFFQKVENPTPRWLFWGLRGRWHPHKRPLRSRKNTLKPSKMYRFCQPEIHFFQKFIFALAPHRRLKTSFWVLKSTN